MTETPAKSPHTHKTPTDGLHYKRLAKRRYELLSDRIFYTGVTGANAEISSGTHHCRLSKDGRLEIFAGFVWDMASGAIDTPDMAIASLAHDAFCYLINEGKLHKRYQPLADREFRRILKRQKCGFIRRWYSWAAVRVFQFFTRR